MPNPTITTRYAGEVLDSILVQAATGNELVEKGLICIKVGIQDGLAIPRLQLTKVLQKRKKNPTSANSKGDVNIDERCLHPQDAMVYLEFDPTLFEHFWKKYQPTGNLLFEQLPDDVKVTLVNGVLTQLGSELGVEFISGVKGDAEGQYFDGVLTRALAAEKTVKVECTENSQIKRLRAVWNKTKSVIRNKPEFVFLMSSADADAYDDEITDLVNKGAAPTEKNPERFKGHRIVPLEGWPDGVIMGTLCSLDEQKSNLFAAVNLASDFDCVQVEKVSNASELYFIKILLKADTQIAWDEAITICDNSVEEVG